jgi:RNA polymerase sigma factor (sigma-70 family)
MAKKPLAGVLQRVCKLAAVQGARELGDLDLLERFVTAQDEAAFAVLVERHGPMVLAVCRRRLGSPHDAEDACQASFLVLAQKAGSIRRSTSLPSWLHGVAARVAANLKRERVRRGRREQESQGATVADPAAEVSWREVQAVLDEELERLPERFRAPLILCYLDGRTRDEAAGQLGLSVACLHGRLERGRKALCERLARRGVTLSAALVAAGLGESAQAGLSPTVILDTARAAMLLRSGGALAKGLVSTNVLTVAQEASRNMSLSKLKLGLSAVLCAGLLTAAVAGSLALGPARAGQGAKASPAASQPQAAAPAAQQATVRGRVVGPDDKPVAGARVYLLRWRLPPRLRTAEDRGPPKVWAETGKDGRFSFTVAQRDLGELFVTAAGYGPGWVIKSGKLQETWPIEDNQLVRLARDDVPVNGRVLDLQGQPVAGATVRVFALKAAPDGNLDKAIKAIKGRSLGQHFLEHEYLSAYRVDGLAHSFPPIGTDRAGRFQIKGVGRDRVVAFTVEGPAIETTALNAMTRPGVGAGDLRVPAAGITFGGGKTIESRMKPYYPPTFTHAADPCRVVTGVVRDKATRKPIAGAIVRGDQPVRYPVYYNRTTTDKEGRFRLTGLPLPRRYEVAPGVVVLPPAGEPYLALIKRVPADKETRETTIDFDLPRGVWLEGQVKDKSTGHGVLAQLRYMTFHAPARPAAGPQGLGSPGPYYRDPYGDMTDNEGKFRLIAALERGVLGASAVGPEAGRYRVGVGADKIDGVTRDDQGGKVRAAPEPFSITASSFDTLVEIKPQKGAQRVRCDVVLDPGRTLTLQVRGPDGKPLDGALVQGQRAGDHLRRQRPHPAEFTVYALEPGNKRTLLLEIPQKNLAARREIKGNERGPVVVTLQPAATVVGQLVEAGRPLAHAEIWLEVSMGPRLGPRRYPRDFRTDAQGKFRIGLIPGVSYRADVLTAGYLRPIFDDLSLKSGETKNLGEVKLKKADE